MEDALVYQVVFTMKAQRHEEFCNNIASNPKGCFVIDWSFAKRQLLKKNHGWTQIITDVFNDLHTILK